MKFIDLFAGIGGFHLALSRLNMTCNFASEIDPFARDVYVKNHKIDKNIFNDDIRNIAPMSIPDHDILCAGFPCQPFSQAGYKRGFNDLHQSERGNLFYNIVEILEAKRPKAFILENVRHLINHDEGKTFKTIIDILEKELNYTVYYKVIKASDFGRPQHRPRVYIVGFNNKLINTFFNFYFPDPIPLKMTMSDIWEGQCSREIGYTLRVGGKGSPIHDRRNWDGYIVNDKEVRLSPKQGKRMMGYPDNFELSPSKTQAMKQLGNSVCVDVVYHIAKNVKNYIDNYEYKDEKVEKMKIFNKGEWSEIYTFLKAIKEQKIYFGNTELDVLNNNSYITICSLQHNNNPYRYTISNGTLNIIKNLNIIETFQINDILSDDTLNEIVENIKNSSGTFAFKNSQLLDYLKVDIFKGTSTSKSDIIAGFYHQNTLYQDDPLGIKSFLGSNPTLLNASSNTNFIFKINNFKGSIDDVNQIQTRSKVQDRIKFIISRGGEFIFERCEKNIFQSNLSIVDSKMPEILSNILLQFYSGQGSKISDLITDEVLIIKIKRLLEEILLGMFPGNKWDGEQSSNGVIVVKKFGDLLLYHTIKKTEMRNYLFYNTKLDTPSTGRHNFGHLFQENNNNYFKLNLQIRNI